MSGIGISEMKKGRMFSVVMLINNNMFSILIERIIYKFITFCKVELKLPRWAIVSLRDNFFTIKQYNWIDIRKKIENLYIIM